jgi:hypothetical protein
MKTAATGLSRFWRLAGFPLAKPRTAVEPQAVA